MLPIRGGPSGVAASGDDEHLGASIHHRHDRLWSGPTGAATVSERFVLDDGHVSGMRRADNAGSATGTWLKPCCLRLPPLVERVRKHGMQFRALVRAGDVNPDSDLHAPSDWFSADPSGCLWNGAISKCWTRAAGVLDYLL